MLLIEEFLQQITVGRLLLALASASYNIWNVLIYFDY